MATETDQAELLAQVAHLYFEKGDDQSTIARRLHVSRSSVSRLLTQARKRGIVEIRIHYPLALDTGLSEAFCERFPLRQALILKTGRHNTLDAKLQVARLAARYLEEHIAPNDTLALSRGSTLRAVVDQFTPGLRRNVRVVQLVGALRISGAAEDDVNLARALALKLGGEYYNLNAPLFVANVETRRALLQEPAICQVLDLARKANLALVGVGSLDRQSSSIVRQRLLATAQVEALRRRAVGEICSQYFDINGRVVSTELSERTMGLDLQALKQIPNVVAVASGSHKARALLGALRGGYVGAMIMDDQAAKRVIELDRPSRGLK
jgi:DNA-binding transcriptional regulator LsrR (DeoR family)